MGHRIYIYEEDERGYWHCSCGQSGSAAAYKVDLASDAHIGAGDTRVDTNKMPG